MTLSETAALTVDQLVAVYDSVETHEDLAAAHQACDGASRTFAEDDRGRVVRAMVAPTARVWVGRTPRCVDCGG
jgi:hypothetical protein